MSARAAAEVVVLVICNAKLGKYCDVNQHSVKCSSIRGEKMPVIGQRRELGDRGAGGDRDSLEDTSGQD